MTRPLSRLGLLHRMFDGYERDDLLVQAWRGAIAELAVMVLLRDAILAARVRAIQRTKAQRKAAGAGLFGSVKGDITMCRYCGRKLTNPQSITLGAGEVCAERHGLCEHTPARKMRRMRIRMPTALCDDAGGQLLLDFHGSLP